MTRDAVDSGAESRARAGRFLRGVAWLAGVAMLLYLLYSSFRPPAGRGAAVPAAVGRLPLYALFSFARMLAAYVLALCFSLIYGYLAATRERLRAVMLPLLDVLQSVPVLGFFPAAVYFFVLLFGGSRLGVEAASVFLIFTSQVWNMTFGVYESLTTIPADLLMASRAYRLEGPLWLRTLVLPACVTKLVYNSMLSWAGGWYFLIACEIIALGPVNVTLPGLGSFLIAAAETGDIASLACGIATLVFIIWLLDYAVWRPLAAGAERFKYEFGGGAPAGRQALSGFQGWRRRPFRTAGRVLGTAFYSVVCWLFGIQTAVSRRLAAHGLLAGDGRGGRGGAPAYAGRLVKWACAAATLAAAGRVLYSFWITMRPPWPPEASSIPAAAAASLLRLGAAYAVSLAWTLPAALWIGRNESVYARLMPVLQVAASVPATALFPFIILLIVRTTGSMQVASVVLVLTGMQWYLLFNLVGAVRAIPGDLVSAARAYGIKGWLFFRSVVLPALFPSLVTGSITAWGGGWNALIVSEYVVYGGRTFESFGIGALLDRATYVTGNLQMIWLSLAAMVCMVVASNRLVWRPLYDFAARRYKMEY